MSAHERTIVFTGEIGVPRREYLYDLRHADLLMIREGYDRRHRHIWSAVRWQTYNILAAVAGSDELRRNGINGVRDILPFPWETDLRQGMSDEDIAGLQADMDAINGSTT